MIKEKLNEQFIEGIMGVLYFDPLHVLHTSPSTASRLERWIERERAPIPRQRERERSVGDGGTGHHLPSATLLAFG
ncbi:hypothetical protein Hanom_Chr07g00602761 [Helianthus anomalus]